MHAPDFWSAPERGWQAQLLKPASALYDLGARLRQITTTAYRASVPVLCVGNLTLGGTGKTPVAVALCESFKTSGRSPTFLTRGYGGRLKGPLLVDAARHRAEDVGDEPLLLAEIAPVVVSSNRVAGAQFAEATGASLIIMDDGFQNPTLEKTLSVVVVDGETGFGNGAVFPAGPLREPVARGLARAHAIILVGGAGTLPERQEFARLPVFPVQLLPDEITAAAVRGRTVVAFAGIGRPRKFFTTLENCGAVLAGTHAFPDHFPYTEAHIAALKAETARRGAALITTHKDLVRIPLALREGIEVLRVRAHFAEPGAIAAFINETLASFAPPARA